MNNNPGSDDLAEIHIGRLILLRTEALAVPDRKQGERILVAIDVFLLGLREASNVSDLIEWARRYNLYARQMIAVAKYGWDSDEARAVEAALQNFESELKAVRTRAFMVCQGLAEEGQG